MVEKNAGGDGSLVGLPAWTLEELATRAEGRLAKLGLLEGPVDGRVARAADPRTVRYYQTLGILDRPLSYEGHKARYGPRHLLQLLAVKALQRHRLPLAEIQGRLYGRSDAELDALLASVPRPNVAPEVPVTTLREVVLAPGLRLVADAGWAPGTDPERLAQAFRAAVNALSASAAALGASATGLAAPGAAEEGHSA